MQINLKKDAFLGQLFPGLKDDDWQDKEPGEEYDLVRWWGEDLELEGMYRLVEES